MDTQKVFHTFNEQKNLQWMLNVPTQEPDASSQLAYGLLIYIEIDFKRQVDQSMVTKVVSNNKKKIIFYLSQQNYLE